MSCKNGKFGDVSNNSSIITSGRGTSTPIDMCQISITRVDTHFDKLDIRVKKSLNFLHPAIQYADKPIFGRRNLQLLSDWANEHPSATDSSASGFSPPLGENAIGSLAEPIKIESKKSVNVPKKELASSPLQISTAKNTKNHKSILPRKIGSSTNKRRSNHGNPIFKVTPKCPKSPLLLKSIHTKAKERRERGSTEKKEKMKSKIPVERKNSDNEKYVGTIRKRCKTHMLRSDDTCAEFEIKNSIFKCTNELKNENTKLHKSSLLTPSGIRKKAVSKKKICQSNVISEYVKNLQYDEKNDLEMKNLVAFKAVPLENIQQYNQ